MTGKYCSGGGLPQKKKDGSLPPCGELPSEGKAPARLRGQLCRPPAFRRQPAPAGGRARSRALPRSLHKLKSMGQAPLPTGAHGAEPPGRNSVKGAVLEPLSRLIPSLDKSTYGFCRQKCSLTLCVALTGASLPAAPHFLRRHFCRAKTPQDFSARENQMMTRKRTAGILAYFKVL